MIKLLLEDVDADVLLEAIRFALAADDENLAFIPAERQGAGVEGNIVEQEERRDVAKGLEYRLCNGDWHDDCLLSLATLKMADKIARQAYGLTEETLELDEAEYRVGVILDAYEEGLWWRLADGGEE